VFYRSSTVTRHGTNAGSEVYTQSLARALAERHEVRVFTRQDDPSLPAYAEADERDPGGPRVHLRVVNNSDSRDRYRHPEIDTAFARALEEFRPDVVHVNHVSHLSTSLLAVASDRGIPLVYTLHDFWLMCPRGQFVQRTRPRRSRALPLVRWTTGPQVCGEVLLALLLGSPEEWEADARRWTAWVAERMRHVREMANLVDVFIAPPGTCSLGTAMSSGCRRENWSCLITGLTSRGSRGDCGNPRAATCSATSAHTFRRRASTTSWRHSHWSAEIPCFACGDGRETPTRRRCGGSRRIFPAKHPVGLSGWANTRNERIVPDVFNRVDAIVVPSIWVENSPLVIHEAQQARVPVVTGDAGGMASMFGTAPTAAVQASDKASMARRCSLWWRIPGSGHGSGPGILVFGERQRAEHCRTHGSRGGHLPPSD